MTFTFDDAPNSVVEVGLPVLEKYGYPATVYIATRNTTAPDYMSWDDVAKVAQAGWEIAAHTHTHPHLTQLTDEKIVEEFETSKLWFAEHGYAPVDFASPYGFMDSRVLKIVKGYYQTHRTGWPHAVNQIPPDWYHLAAYDVGNDIKLAAVSKMLDSLQKTGGWVILVMHHVTPRGEPVEYSSDTNLLEDIAKLVKARGIPVLTVEEALKKFS